MGTYGLTLTVTSKDRQLKRAVFIEIINKLPTEIVVPPSLCFTGNSAKYVELGCTLFVHPFVLISAELPYQWGLDRQLIERANSLAYGFKPAKAREHTPTPTVKHNSRDTKAVFTYNISVSGVDKVSANIPMRCCEVAGKRPFVAGDSIYGNEVYELVPVPGQSVNEMNTAGSNGENTHETACAYA